MSDRRLRSDLLKLASEKPELRKDLLPLLAETKRSKKAYDERYVQSYLKTIASLAKRLATTPAEDWEEITSLMMRLVNHVVLLAGAYSESGAWPRSQYNHLKSLLTDAVRDM